MLASLTAFALPGQDRKAKMFGDAEAYERFMGRWSSKLAPLLVDFAKVGEEGTALDVGSGTGALAFSLARLRTRCSVVGIDPSEEYVGYAASKNPFPGRVKFQTGDAQDLKFADSTFDCSLSLLVWNFIPDRKKALQEVRRATKPGGCVAAAVWDYPEGMRMLRVFWDASGTVDPAARKLDESRMPLCRFGELGDLWKSNGLERVREQPLEITMQFASFADFWEPFLLGQGPAGAYFRNVEAGRRAAVREEVKRRLAVRSEEAPLSLPSRAWAVRGTVPR